MRKIAEHLVPGLGILVGAAGSQALCMLAKSLLRAEEIPLDWRIVPYTLGCGTLATLPCGLLPAMRGTRRGIVRDLEHSSRTQVSTHNPLQWLLVAVQVALAVVLLVGAGLLLRSFQEPLMPRRYSRSCCSSVS